MDESIFKRGLEPDSSIPEKLQGLIEAGADVSSLAQVFGVGDSTVNSWSLGAVLTPRSANKLDGMISSLQTLTAEGLEPSEAAARTLDLLTLTEDEPAVEEAPEPELTPAVVAADESLPGSFAEDASVQQRLTALMEAGFSRETIADTLAVTQNTIVRWLRGSVRLQNRPYEKLNNVRVAMKMLLEAGLDAETAAIWMQSPINSSIDNIPAYKITHEPKLVLGAIQRLFLAPVK